MSRTPGGRIVAPQNIIPPLLSRFHKGQNGRILVIGGCEDYSGAPYMAAISAGRTGADMCHIICTREASTVVKTYSPDIMVHGYLEEGKKVDVPQKAIDLLDRVHVVLIGCGLGRDPALHDQVKQLIHKIHEKKLPMVFDADGLFLVQNDHSLIDHGDVTLTPNVVEMTRLAKSAGQSELEGKEAAEQFCRKLGTKILLKGDSDVITTGALTEISSIKGSPRRASGQGDLLAGCLTAFMAWREAYKNRLWSVKPVALAKTDASEDDLLFLAAGLGASGVIRNASSAAFTEKSRSMMAMDVLEHIGVAFTNSFGPPAEEE